MELLKSYEERFKIHDQEYALEIGRFIIDRNKNMSLSTQLPTLIIDTDYTILDTQRFKKVFTSAFAEYNSILRPEVVLETYNQSKDRENFYNYPRHMELLAQKISGNQTALSQAIEDLRNIMNSSIASHHEEWVYPNIRDLFNTYKDTINIIIMTSGLGEFQRMKLAAILHDLHINPAYIVFVEKLDKGAVIHKLFLEGIFAQELEEQGIIILDDNIDELISVHEQNPKNNIKLLRIKQPDGNYNHKALVQADYITELDCTLESKTISL